MTAEKKEDVPVFKGTIWHLDGLLVGWGKRPGSFMLLCYNRSGVRKECSIPVAGSIFRNSTVAMTSISNRMLTSGGNLQLKPVHWEIFDFVTQINCKWQSLLQFNDLLKSTA